MTPDPSRPFANRDVGESSREWRRRVGTLRPDARCADYGGRHEQQQGRRCQKTRRGAPWSRLQSQALGARAAPMLGPAGTKSETLLAAPLVVTARTIMSRDGKLVTGQSCGAGVVQTKRPSGAESWPYGLTLGSVADMSTSLSALSSTVISTFLSRVALQLEVIELRHQLGSSGARSLSTLACTKLALQDLGAGRQREKQHDTLNRL